VIPSRRSLVPDPDFDALVEAVVGKERVHPDGKRKKFRTEAAVMTSERGVFGGSNNNGRDFDPLDRRRGDGDDGGRKGEMEASAAVALEAAGLQKAIHRKRELLSSMSPEQRPIMRYQSIIPTAPPRGGGLISRSANDEGNDTVAFKLDRFPLERGLKKLKRPYLRVSGAARIGDLRDFVRHKLLERERLDVVVEGSKKKTAATAAGVAVAKLAKTLENDRLQICSAGRPTKALHGALSLKEAANRSGSSSSSSKFVRLYYRIKPHVPREQKR